MQLFNGDCLEILKDISSNSVDLVICDLPFGCLTPCGVASKNPEKYPLGTKTGGCSWDIKIDLESFWKEIKRIRKDDHTPCIHFCTTKYGYELIQSNEKEFRYDLVWDKNRGVSFLSANKMPMRSHEMLYVFSKKGAYYNRVDISGNFPEVKAWGKDETAGVYNFIGRTTVASAGRRCVKSVIEILNFGKKGRHPTEKPVELYKFLIERYCPQGGTVLDPTFGSCNSGVAARELNRNYIGIEKDKTFFDKAKIKFG